MNNDNLLARSQSNVAIIICIIIMTILLIIIIIITIILTLPPRILCRSIFFFFHSSRSNSLWWLAIILFIMIDHDWSWFAMNRHQPIHNWSSWRWSWWWRSQRASTMKMIIMIKMRKLDDQYNGDDHDDQRWSWWPVVLNNIHLPQLQGPASSR